jgi:hypothetical protein
MHSLHRYEAITSQKERGDHLTMAPFAPCLKFLHSSQDFQILALAVVDVNCVSASPTRLLLLQNVELLKLKLGNTPYSNLPVVTHVRLMYEWISPILPQNSLHPSLSPCPRSPGRINTLPLTLSRSRQLRLFKKASLPANQPHARGSAAGERAQADLKVLRAVSPPVKIG